MHEDHEEINCCRISARNCSAYAMWSHYIKSSNDHFFPQEINLLKGTREMVQPLPNIQAFPSWKAFFPLAVCIHITCILLWNKIEPKNKLKEKETESWFNKLST